MDAYVIGLTPMSPVMTDAGTVVMPVLVRMTKVSAVPRSTAAVVVIGSAVGGGVGVGVGAVDGVGVGAAVAAIAVVRKIAHMIEMSAAIEDRYFIL